ncbi:MAG: iron-containing alcohol dehydrogenase [Planctomycetia bacterium]|jgi:glycerol-1-phosphate dehydrogenase [NAD(P)+]
MPQASSRNELIDQAVQQAEDTRAVEIGTGAIQSVPKLLREFFFSDQPSPQNAAAVIVADRNTWQAAGHQVHQLLNEAQPDSLDPIVLDVPDLHATAERVEQVEEALKPLDATPIAVGSGTINDLVKLASHNLDRPYLTVATAASMDGYTAFGASVVYDNSKQTMYCPAPRVVVADLDILANAPPEMNAAGYGDLLAKVVAGADWIVADILEIEPIHEPSWALTQNRLHSWVSQPEGIRDGEPEALADLTLGLLMTGFGMQSARSSRPASGAEHQFSHLWDMQHHTYKGHIPLHGNKVSIGLLASTMMYEQFLAIDIIGLDIPSLMQRWPSLEEIENQIIAIQANEELIKVARTECREKYIDAPTLGRRLEKLQTVWLDLRSALRKQLIPLTQTRQMLEAAGGMTHPSQIGIEPSRLYRSFAQAQQIRRRFTILDIATHLGCLDAWAEGCMTQLT